jgi:hypothetical protein
MKLGPAVIPGACGPTGNLVSSSPSGRMTWSIISTAVSPSMLSSVFPCHGSTFSLQDGALLHGPATAPQPAYLTRVRDDKVEVRLAHA